jgi:hypothetical protein
VLDVGDEQIERRLARGEDRERMGHLAASPSVKQVAEDLALMADIGQAPAHTRGRKPTRKAPLRMTGSAFDRLPGRAELRQLAELLVEVLEPELGSGSFDWGNVELVSSGEMAEKDHAACLGMMCAQQLHCLGSRRDQIDPDDVFVLASVLSYVLNRLRDHDVAPSQQMQEIHHRLVEIGMHLSGPILQPPGEWRGDRS